MLYRIITEKPQHYLFGLSLLLSLLSLPLTDELVELHLFDTYIVMHAWHQLGVILLLLALNAGLYWVVRHRPKVNWMTVFHLIVLSLFGGVAVAWGYNNTLMPYSSLLVVSVLLLLLLFVLANLVFVINLAKAWWQPTK